MAYHFIVYSYLLSHLVLGITKYKVHVLTTTFRKILGRSLIMISFYYIFKLSNGMYFEKTINKHKNLIKNNSENILIDLIMQKKLALTVNN